MEKLRKAIAMLVAVAMVFTSVSVPAYAETSSEVTPNMSTVKLIPTGETELSETAISDMQVVEPGVAEKTKELPFSVTAFDGYKSKVEWKDNAAKTTAEVYGVTLDGNQFTVNIDKARPAFDLKLTVRYTKEGAEPPAPLTKDLTIRAGEIKKITGFNQATELQKILPEDYTTSVAYGTKLSNIVLAKTNDTADAFKGTFQWDEPKDTLVGAGFENDLRERAGILGDLSPR